MIEAVSLPDDVRLFEVIWHPPDLVFSEKNLQLRKAVEHAVDRERGRNRSGLCTIGRDPPRQIKAVRALRSVAHAGEHRVHRKRYIDVEHRSPEAIVLRLEHESAVGIGAESD